MELSLEQKKYLCETLKLFFSRYHKIALPVRATVTIELFDLKISTSTIHSFFLMYLCVIFSNINNTIFPKAHSIHIINSIILLLIDVNNGIITIIMIELYMVPG